MNFGRSHRLKQKLKFIQNNTTILDIGCGEGDFLSNLQKYKVIKKGYGVDWNKNNLDIAKEKNPSFNFIQADVTKETLPFKNSSIGVVVCSHLIEHLYPSELYNLLKEMSRIAKHQIIISAPLDSRDFWMNLTHIRPYHPSCIINYLCNERENQTFENLKGNFNIKKIYWRVQNPFYHSKNIFLKPIKSVWEVVFTLIPIGRKNGFLLVLEKRHKSNK